MNLYTTIATFEHGMLTVEREGDMYLWQMLPWNNNLPEHSIYTTELYNADYQLPDRVVAHWEGFKYNLRKD